MTIAMIKAGKMRHFISLERQTETVMPSGSVSKTWAAYATVRAELITQELADYLNGTNEGTTGTVAFRLWYIAGVSTADRITYNGETYAITGVIEITNGRGMELRAVTQ